MFVPLLQEKQSNDTCSKWNRKLHFSQQVSNVTDLSFGSATTITGPSSYEITPNLYLQYFVLHRGNLIALCPII